VLVSLPVLTDALSTALTFDNAFTTQLPGDADSRPIPRQVLGAAWSPAAPTPVSAPRLLAYSREMADVLGLSPADVESDAFASVFGGNALLTGMQPFAMCYGGHQFGNWAGQLGDGRAISLGEVVNAAGERWELQLKGAGRTPYSRTADGRAVLRSSIREFLCSEAMHHLGVPTTRALSLVATGDDVVRDMFYNGNAAPEPGAIVCRVAPSFIRFGNFEILAARGDRELLQQLIDFTIARDFPHIDAASPSRIATWFAEVCARTATMIVGWMRVGFTHGVMNTDNMSILGLTIDYGPYGWVDNFDPDWTPNTTDSREHRYAFAKQPAVALWNLTRLAEAISVVAPDTDAIAAGLDVYRREFNTLYTAMMAAKLGFPSWGTAELELATDLFNLMERTEIDFTIFFRALSSAAMDTLSRDTLAHAAYDATSWTANSDLWTEWVLRYVARVREVGEPETTRIARMHSVNPIYVLRNYMAQQVIDTATAGDASGISTLLEVLRRPYDAQPGMERFAEKRPEWARDRAGCSRLSCSS
jgi:uncharacterized protein YdiU (UPF0061 family)